MGFFIEIFLIFALPSIAAFVAIGGAGKKLGWYAGTAGLVFFVDIFVGALFMAYAQVNHLEETDTLLGLDVVQRSMVTWYVMLIVLVGMIAMAANSGKKCRACMSRINPKATRCPKCQADLVSTPSSASLPSD